MTNASPTIPSGLPAQTPSPSRSVLRPSRATISAWVLLCVITAVPYIAAQTWPPPGKKFIGTFFYPDDFHQYLSFAEQSVRGVFFLRNKFSIHPEGPAIVNLEWSLAGVMGRLLGGSPKAGFDSLRPLALGLLVTGAARLLARAGLSGGRLAWALGLFLSGAGLGALRLWQGTIGWQIPDLLMGMYPWHQSLLNIHTALGTGLLLWTTALYLEWRAGERSRWGWLGVGALLGLCRPYELLPFAAVATVLAAEDVLRSGQWRVGVSRILDLVWFSPFFFYYGLLTSRWSPLQGWDGTLSGDLSPPVAEFLLAIAPASLVVAAFARGADRNPMAREVQKTLAIWCTLLVCVVLFYHAPLVKSFVTSLGVAVLLLAGLVTPRRWLPVATLLLCPTSLFLLWRVLNPPPYLFVSVDYFTAADYLKAACQPQQIAVAPTDLSLLIAALTPCSVAFGHRSSTPDYPLRMFEGNRFYHDPDTTPQWRLDYLRTIRATFVLLPPGGGLKLGPHPPYSRKLTLPRLEVWQAEEPL